MKRVVTACVLGLAAAACSNLASSSTPSTPSQRLPAETGSGAASTTEEVTVERVVDGDTFVAVEGAHRFRVRLIGVDTPETVKPNTPVQCFGPQASAYAHRLLIGRRVRLVYDVDRYDPYGRVLAYVYVGSSFFNLDVVRLGYGVVLTVPPDVAHVDDFLAAQRAARSARLGLWLACPLR
ncbi:MAG: thermonuclease family protein [Actinomycetota bacterium]